jgi:hypothetical protein
MNETCTHIKTSGSHNEQNTEVFAYQLKCDKSNKLITLISRMLFDAVISA